MFYIPLSNFPWARDRACFETREGRRKEAFHPVYYRSSPSQVRITLSAPIFAPSSKKKNNVPRVIPWILSRPRDEKIWSLRRGKAPLVRGGRSCPEEQQGSPLLSSFLFPFLSRTELPFHRVSIFPIQPRSPANVNSVGKVGDRVPRLSFAHRFFVFRPSIRAPGIFPSPPTRSVSSFRASPSLIIPLFVHRHSRPLLFPATWPDSVPWILERDAREEERSSDPAISPNGIVAFSVSSLPILLDRIGMSFDAVRRESGW